MWCEGVWRGHLGLEVVRRVVGLVLMVVGLVCRGVWVLEVGVVILGWDERWEFLLVLLGILVSGRRRWRLGLKVVGMG